MCQSASIHDKPVGFVEANCETLIICCDNTSAIFLVNNLKGVELSKQIKVKDLKVQELLKNHVVDVRYIPWKIK